MINKKELPLRIGVGIILLNHENNIFVGKRIDNPKNSWQMPQGGVDQNENFLQAAKRELEEEGEEFLINSITDNQLNYAVKLLSG